MDKSEIALRVKKVMGPFLKTEKGEMGPDSKLIEYFDSLSLMEMIFRFEDEFGITISDEMIPQFQTFQDVVDGLAKVIQQASGKK